MACLCLALALPATARAEPDDPAAVAAMEKIDGKLTFDDAKNVVGLDLADAQATDADLAHLAGLPNLVRLELWGADISDATLCIFPD